MALRSLIGSYSSRCSSVAWPAARALRLLRTFPHAPSSCQLDCGEDDGGYGCRGWNRQDPSPQNFGGDAPANCLDTLDAANPGDRAGDEVGGETSCFRIVAKRMGM